MFLKVIVVTILLVIQCYGISQPAYQVSIWLKPYQEHKDVSHLCNGAIIHERLILTSAGCMFYNEPGSNKSYSIGPLSIYIVAGTNSGYNSEIVRYVDSIEIAQGFNLVTLENDLVLLKLNESLPLAKRSDIKWIILDDDDFVNETCTASFYNPTSYVAAFPQTQSEFVLTMTDENCTKLSQFGAQKQKDICSDYILGPGTMCHITKDSLETSSDRGTALVCNSRLAGVLSIVVETNNHRNQSCEEVRKRKAFYTNVGAHLNWIYGEIAVASSEDPTSENAMAAPYAASAPVPSIYHVSTESTGRPTISIYTESTTMSSSNTTPHTVVHQGNSGASSVALSAISLSTILIFTCNFLMIVI